MATGGPKYITLADFDVVEVSNLNRIRATLLDIGTHKAELAARCVWETDPFAEISIFDRGVSKETLHSFINEPSPIDVFIDAMDSLALKVEAREACRRARIPVLMATDLADGILLDVERYDENPAYQLFHGTVGQITGDMVHALDYRAWAQLATKIIGSENLPPRMRSSLLEIGKTLPAVPQLATGAAVAGSALAYAVRMIVCGMPLSSGRYRIGFDDLIGTVEDRAARLKEDGMSDEKFKSKFFS